MASYSNKNYTFDGLKVQYGLGLAFNMAGKYPAITKRIFDTKAMAQAFIDDKDDSAVVGLTLTVIADTTAENNGVYFVKSIGDGTNPGILEQLGSSQGTSDVKDALEKLQQVVGVTEKSGLTEALKDTKYLSGATTDSVVDALIAIDTALDNIQDELTKTQITGVTFNDVNGTVTSSDTGTKIALTADTSDIKVADDFTTTEYPTELTGATAIETGETISSAFKKVEGTISTLTSEVLKNEETTAAAVKALGESAGLIDDNDEIKYTANTGATYIKEANSLADADNKLDAAIKSLDSKLTVGSSDKTVTVAQTADGTDLKVNIDGKTLTANTDGVISTNLSVTALSSTEIAALSDSANVKEAYKVVDGDGATKGDIIKIYKDSSLKSADFVNEKPAETEGGEATAGQFLKLVYILADGSEKTVYVDMSTLIAESEVENGIQNKDGKLSIKIDANSEKYLTVGADGLKLSGVDNAIAAAATVITGATANKNLTVTSSTATDGHKEYTITETGLTLTADKNYAKANNTVAANIEALDTQIKTNADDIAENKVTAVTFNSVTGTITANTAGTSVSLTVDGDDVAIGDYTAVTYAEPFSTKTGVAAVETGDTLDEAINKVEGSVKVLVDEVLANEQVASKAITSIVNAAGIKKENGVISYTANTEATYIKEANSLADADNKLDAAIKSLDSKLTISSTGKTVDITQTATGTNLETKLATKATDSAVGLSSDGTNGVQVSLSTTNDNAISLSQTGGTLKATLGIDGDSDSTTTTGVKLSQSTNGLKAELNLNNDAASKAETEGAKADGGIGLAVTDNGDVKATLYWGEF